MKEVAVAVIPGAEPFAHDGSDSVGVLLCHGFTSTPQSMRDWAKHLAAEDFTVRCPLLPGHGTTWRDLNRTTWNDWYATAERSLAELRERCESVFVFGQSMGGTLALRLAQRHPEINGLVLVNPSVLSRKPAAPLLPVLSWVVPSLAGLAGDIAKSGVRELAYDRVPLRAAASLQRLWRIVRAELGGIRQPVLLYRSGVDHVVEPHNSKVILDRVASTDLTEHVLRDSFHVVTLDHDAPSVFAGSVEFARRVHRERAGDVV